MRPRKLLLAFAALPLLLAACGDDIRMPWDKPLDATPAVVETPQSPASQPLVSPQVSPTQVPIEVEGDRKAVATAESVTLNTTAFVARGNEPFWRVDVSDGTARYQTPDNEKGRNVPVRRIAYAKGVEYIGELNGSAFALNIRATKCVDTMSGEKFPMTSALRIGSNVVNGCAGPMQAPPAAPKADATAATAEAAPEAAKAAPGANG